MARRKRKPELPDAANEQEIRDAGYAIDVPFESGSSDPQEMEYEDLGPEKGWSPPPGFEIAGVPFEELPAVKAQRQQRDKAGGGAATHPQFTEGSELLVDAYEFAAEKHAGALRRGPKGEETPYIEHPVEVARLISEAGYGEDVIAAALLHDVVEDAKPPVRPEQIDERFGRTVGRLVRALTENKDERIRDFYDLRKQLHREKIEVAGEEAQAIYCADKLANIRDLRQMCGEHGERVLEKFEFNAPSLDVVLDKADAEGAMLRSAGFDSPLLSDLADELAGFREQRGAAG